MRRPRCRPRRRARLALQSHGRPIYRDGDTCHHADMPPTLAYNVTPRPRRPFPQGQSICPDLDRSFENDPRKLSFSVLKNKEKSWLLAAGIRGHSRPKLGDCVHPLARMSAAKCGEAASPIRATGGIGSDRLTSEPTTDLSSMVRPLSSSRINCSSICGLVEREVRATLHAGSGDPVRYRFGNDAHVRASGAGS